MGNWIGWKRKRTDWDRDTHTDVTRRLLFVVVCRAQTNATQAQLAGLLLLLQHPRIRISKKRRSVHARLLAAGLPPACCEIRTPVGVVG
jgi:hypothetical protein